MEYDLVVIGGGPGGYVAAARGAKLGLKTLLIEKDRMGGTCLNRGCIPTKALLYCTEMYAHAKESENFGVQAKVRPFDYGAAFTHKEQTMKRLRLGVESLVKRSGGTILYGSAELCDPNTIRVNEETIGFKDLIIATGSVPSPFPFSVGEGAPVVDSDGFLALEKIPETCLVIGGGVIGLEFATILSRIDRKVIVVEAMDRILPTMEADLGSIIVRALKAKGVEFYTKTFVQQIEKKGASLLCTVKRGEELSTIKADLAIGAVGRIAQTADLHPERASLAMNRSFIKVDDRCATSTPHIYAIGDVNGERMLAHAASWQGTKVVDNIVHGTNHSALSAKVPGCVYTEPELASVGLTEAEAKAEGYDIRIGRFDAIGNGKMLSMGKKAGMVKLIAEATTGELLGAQIAAPHATDLIAELTLLIEMEGTVQDLCETIHPHPTISEMIMEAAAICSDALVRGDQ